MDINPIDLNVQKQEDDFEIDWDLVRKNQDVEEGVGDKFLQNRGVMPDEEQEFDRNYNVEDQEEIVHDLSKFKDEPVYIVKNPKNLDNIGCDVRGVIDNQGNLYVETESIVLHDEIILPLAEKGLLEYINDWHHKLPEKFLTVHRNGCNNEFAIGESNMLYGNSAERDRETDASIPPKEKADLYFHVFMDSAAQKNPHIKFPHEKITDGARNKFNESVKNIVTQVIKESYINSMNEATTMTLDALPFKSELEGLGGKIFSVGGAVRDKFLGKDSKDLDILVTGIPEETLINRLQKYGKAGKHGKAFGVIKFKPTGADPTEEPIDIALPRTEVSTGAGHKNFEVKVDPTLSVEDDLRRRDFTINAMATDINGDIIDPFNGQQDLKDKVIRMTYPNSFRDDELRMLRAVQFASRFEGFEIEPETFKAIQKAADTIREVSPERWMEEFEKIVFKGDALKGAQLLKDTGLMKAMFGKEKDIPVHAVWNTIKTLGEFMYMLMIGLVDEPSTVFKNNLKGDIATMKEMKALEEMEKVTKDRRLNRGIVFQMLKLAPETVKSGLVPNELKPAIQDLMSGKYPKNVGDLTVNGNDLITLNVEPRQRGVILNSMLDNIYADNLENERETLLNFVKSQQNVT